MKEEREEREEMGLKVMVKLRQLQVIEFASLVGMVAYFTGFT